MYIGLGCFSYNEMENYLLTNARQLWLILIFVNEERLCLRIGSPRKVGHSSGL